MAGEKIYPFEEALEKLSALVEKMESGDLSLEESLKLFEGICRLLAFPRRITT